MGGTRYSDAEYTARVTRRSFTGTPTFAYNAAIHSGATAATVHKTLSPYGVKIRESRDSNGQEKIPIIITLDTTGSMQGVPVIVQQHLPKLMGGFLNDKVSGKKYLGENGYPDILISAVDDVFAQGPDGALQIGQFESGIEIDDDITNLWMTGNGGGNRGESYDLALYFAARHTAHDHWDKRKRKGYMFILGDEPVFGKTTADSIKRVFGETVESDLSVKQIVKEVQKRYHVIWGVPRGHEHTYAGQMEEWKALFGDERVIVFDADKVCEFIVSTVAILESSVALSELEEDSVAVGSLSTALAPLASKAGAVTTSDMPDLPVPTGPKGKAKRI